MAFYDLQKEERAALTASIQQQLYSAFEGNDLLPVILYFSDQDTYIRKAAYTATGRIYNKEEGLRPKLLRALQQLLLHPDYKVRQTTVNAAGEVGKQYFDKVNLFFDAGLTDKHHAVRNVVIGSIKKMGAVNPGPVLAWARPYLQHPDKEIRREICHGIELRGRTHPEDILPLLRCLEWDATARVRHTLVHVIGQIAYKRGCLEKVVAALAHWENRELVKAAFEEILSVHHRYRKFSALSPEEAGAYLKSRATL